MKKVVRKLRSTIYIWSIKIKSLLGKHADPLSDLLFKFSKDHRDEIFQTVENLFKFYDVRACRLILKKRNVVNLTKFDAESALNHAIANLVPSKLKEKLAQKDIYFWTSIERRISGDFIIASQFSQDTSSELAKNYLNNIIRIHSKKDIESITLSQYAGYTKTDILTALELQVVAAKLQQLAVAKRICAKGGTLVCNPKFFTATTSKITSQALNKHDELNNRFSTFYNRLGFADLGVRVREHGDEEIQDFYIFGASPFVNLKGFRHMGTGETTRPNKLDSTELLLFNKHFENLFYSEYGMTFNAWLKCMVVFTSGFIYGPKSYVMHKMTVTGYALGLNNQILDELKKVNVPSEEMERFLELASFKFTPNLHDHLLALEHDYFLHKIGNENVLIDGYLVLGYILKTFTNIVKKYPDDRFNRGNKFEDQIGEHISLLNLPQPFKSGLELFLNASPVGEFDHTLRVGKVLVSVDCKSIMGDHGLDLGSYKDTRKRIGTLREKITDKDRKMKVIADLGKGDNFKIQESKICVQIITACNEWLPPNEPVFWWAAGVPRMCRIEVFNEVVLPFLKENLNDLQHSSIHNVTQNLQ